jgi:hypothetical protein
MSETIDAAQRALEALQELAGLSNSDLVELGKALIIRGEAANHKMTGWRALDFNGEFQDADTRRYQTRSP